MPNTRPTPPGTVAFRCPGEALRFADDALPTVGHRTWNQVARLGAFKGHPQGEFAFTPQVFRQLIANHEATSNGEVPVDYEHASETLPPGHERTGVPAVAWIHSLEQREGDDGQSELWGEFEWVDPDAVAAVRAGQYRYLSPAVSFNATHRESGAPIGPRLTSAALTNHPFLDGMAPVTATTRTLSDPDLDVIVRAVLSRLPKDPAHRFGLTPGEVHVPTPTRKPMSTMMEKLRARFKLADDAGEDTMMAAFEDLCREIDGYRAETEQKKLAESAECADRALRDYGLPATARAVLAAQCMADRRQFDAVYPPRPTPMEPWRTPVETAVLTRRVTHHGAVGDPLAATAAQSAEDEDHTLAERLLTENPRQFPTYEAAIRAAEQRNNEKRADAFIARFAHGGIR